MVEPGKEHRFAKALYHAGTLWFSYPSSLHFCSPQNPGVANLTMSHLCFLSLNKPTVLPTVLPLLSPNPFHLLHQGPAKIFNILPTPQHQFWPRDDSYLLFTEKRESIGVRRQKLLPYLLLHICTLPGPGLTFHLCTSK